MITSNADYILAIGISFNLIHNPKYTQDTGNTVGWPAVSTLERLTVQVPKVINLTSVLFSHSFEWTDLEQLSAAQFSITSPETMQSTHVTKTCCALQSCCSHLCHWVTDASSTISRKVKKPVFCLHPTSQYIALK